MGPDCTDIYIYKYIYFVFKRATATHGISFLLYKCSDVTRVSPWARKPLLVSLHQGGRELVSVQC